MVPEDIQHIIDLLEEELTFAFGTQNPKDSTRFAGQVREAMRRSVMRAKAKGRDLRKILTILQDPDDAHRYVIDRWQSRSLPTLEKIGAEMGISRQRVEQMIREAERLGFVLRDPRPTGRKRKQDD